MRHARALWLVLILGAGWTWGSSVHGDDIRDSLVVQTAMRQARAALAQGDAASAVQLLEAHLTRSSGHLGYLHLLEQAYQAQIQKLQEGGRADAAAPLLQRLAILQGNGGASAGGAPQAAAATLASEPVVRGKGPNIGSAAEPLRLADQKFLAKQFDKAALFYRQAFDLDRDLPLVSRERWAYCLLHEAVERLNAEERVDAEALAKQVRFALDLAPRLEFGRKVLDELAKRQPAAASAASGAAEPSRLRTSRDGHGWDILESAHFKLYHRGYAHAERVVEIAERTRAAVARKWLGGDQTLRWASPCEIYLHADGSAYAQATGQSPQSPGHMSLHAEKNDASRVYGRRIDLQATHPYLLDAVLPHETTHVVLADQFGRHYLPRWADEGLAVLSEPYDRIGRHLQGLAGHYGNGRAFSAAELMRLNDYPEPGRMGVFYGQSVCLVQFLAEQRGPQTVVAFLRAALDQGYEPALRTFYDMSMEELDQRLRQFIEAGTPSLTARRGP